MNCEILGVVIPGAIVIVAAIVILVVFRPRKDDVDAI